MKNFISSKKENRGGELPLHQSPCHGGKNIVKPSDLRNDKNSMDMTTGPIFSQMVLFSIPIMFSGILQLLFNAADVVVVGKFAGNNALAAVGATTALISLMINVSLGLSIGSNVVVARLFGARQYGDMSKAVHTTVLMSLYVGAAVGILGFFGSKYILILMGTPKAIIGLSTIYVKIFFLGTIGNLVYNYGSAVLRAIGDSKRPFYYLVIAGIVNVSLNLVFVILFKMSVAGVALATIISQYVSAFLILQCLLRSNGRYRLEWKKLRIDMKSLKDILWIGLPSGLSGTIFSMTNVVIQSSVNSFGEIVVAGNSISQNIEGFIYISMNSFANTALSFVSQNMGARKIKRVMKSFINSSIFATFVGIVIAGLAIYFKDFLISIYTTSSDVAITTNIRLSFIATTYFICGLMDTASYSLRGLGYSIAPTVITLLCVCSIRMFWIAFFFRMERFHTVGTVYTSYPVSWSVTTLVLTIIFFSVYKKKKTEMGM